MSDAEPSGCGPPAWGAPYLPLVRLQKGLPQLMPRRVIGHAAGGMVSAL